MNELYDTGRQLGQLLRGLVSGLGEAGEAAPGQPMLQAAGGAEAMAFAEAASPMGAVEPPDVLIRPAVLGLLVSLARGADQTGPSLMQLAAVDTGGAVAVGPGTTYRALQRLRADGLVQQGGDRPPGQLGNSTPQAGAEAAASAEATALATERRLSYQITEAGRRSLQQQASLILTLADAVRRAGIQRPAPPLRRRRPNPVPEDFNTVLPHLVVRDPAAAAAFYKEAFDADELYRDVGQDGRIWHLELLIRGTRIPLAGEFSGMKLVAPDRDTNSVILHMYVPDVDATYRRAVASGATGLLAPDDTYWGQRYSQVQDPFGHRWAIASRTEDLSPEQERQGARSYRERNPTIALDPPM